MQTIQVKTELATYPVWVGTGQIKKLHTKLERLLGGKLPRIFVLTSPEVWALWGAALLESFEEEPYVLFLPPGEVHKRLREVERLASEMSAHGADRSSLLIAFGGGIVGDVGGFLAAIYMRGIRFVQVPTTLLAQVDSSVGGKTGVNLPEGKNLIGAFAQPLAVLADVSVLSTLPDRELRAGLFESVKAGIIRNPKLFNYLERNVEAVLRQDTKALEHVVAASIRMKADVVGIDEREHGLRMILNLGHTIGHAIETVTRYRALLHGEAVAWGMIAALEIAASRGTITEAQWQRARKVIAAYGPLPSFRATPAALVAATARDKKNRGAQRRFVLPNGIGDAVVVEDVTPEEMRTACVNLLRTMQTGSQFAEAGGGAAARKQGPRR